MDENTRKLPTVNTVVSNKNKKDTPTAILRNVFNEIIDRNDFEKVLFTDASKKDCAIITITQRLPHSRYPFTDPYTQLNSTAYTKI